MLTDPDATVDVPGVKHRWQQCCPKILSINDRTSLLIGAHPKIGDYAFCLLFEALQLGDRPALSYFNHDHLIEEIVAHLDITTCLYSLAGFQFPEGTSLAAYQEITGGQLSVGPREVQVETDNNFHEIKIVAATDIDQDGLEDIVVTVFDRAKGGTMYLFFPMALSRKSKDGTVTANIIGNRLVRR